MRLFYTAFILFIYSSIVFSQKLELAPLQSNPVLRSHAAHLQQQREVHLADEFGVSLNKLDAEKDGLNGCPPQTPFGKIIVESGRTVEIEVDTFGLAIDSTPPTLTLLQDPPLLFGTASYIDSIITVRYQANDGIASFETDTILLRYQQGAGIVDTILKIAIDVRRKDKTLITEDVLVNAGETTGYCLDDEIDFPTEIRCFQFEDCFSRYDGDGYQFKYFYKDTCLIYIASRFPGVDTVCVQLCDAVGVCDLFKIPFKIIGDTLSLLDGPFFEDFSNNFGPYPSKELWLENDVYINNTFAKNPPSIGMATFDGLMAGGQPYELPGGGFADQLTSKPINLSSLNPNNNVFLRFFVAPQGFGQEPEDDDFVVEFRNKQLEWVEVLKINGTGLLPSDSIPPFQFYAIKLDQQNYFHNAFQMRFRAETSPGGYGDWWHLDYIHLDRNSTDVNNFTDFAFSTIPSTFLKNYTAIPLRHLKADLANEIKATPEDPYSVVISNRSNAFQANFSDSSVKYFNNSTGNQLGSNFTVASGPESLTDILSFKGLDVNIPSGNRTALINGLAMLPDDSEVSIETRFEFVGNASEDETFKSNDTASLNTVFSNYFAHDDGTAERQLVWNDPTGGQEVAVQYKTNVADSLHGVQIMFPHFTFYDIEAQFFNLKIWLGDENGPDHVPVYEQELMKPFFPDSKWDTLQGFTTYRLEDLFGVATPLALPANTYFYVGIEQVSTADRSIPIGYDFNNPCDCNFRRSSPEIDWSRFPSNFTPGALMIRALFESRPNTSNSAAELTEGHILLNIYPNPVRDVVNIKLEGIEIGDFSFIIFNQLGQPVKQGVGQGSSIPVYDLNDGPYFVQIFDPKSGRIWVEKFVVAK